MLNPQTQIEKWLFEPPAGPWAPVLRFLRYPYALLRDFLKGELNLRAMSLVYTTIFSVVPLLAFAFAIFKGLGVHRDLEPVLLEFFRPLGENADDMTRRVMGFVENISSGVLGSVGLAILLFTVVSTIQKIESAFNFVWRVERPRSLTRRISEYLSLMIIGPVVAVAALSLTAAALDTAVIEKLTRFKVVSTAVAFAGRLVPYLLVSTLFGFLYSFIPNTKVRFKAALIGGLTAGFLWAVAGAIFTTFIAYSTRLTVVYSSFAILVISLIWIYIAWLILLFGAQLSYYVQNPQAMLRGQQEPRLTASLAEQLAINVMYLIAKHFKTGEAGWTTNRLAERLNVPSILLGPVIRSLESAGLLAVAENDVLLPRRDIAEIDLNMVVSAARDYHKGEPTVRVRGAPQAQEVASQIDAALRERLEGKTLRAMVEGE